MNKEEAMEIIVKLLEESKHLELNVVGGVCSWKKPMEEMTPKDWKNIGYIGGFAFAFDIKDINIDKVKCAYCGNKSMREIHSEKYQEPPYYCSETCYGKRVK